MLDIPLDSTIAVSRMGSGSHVMAVVLQERIRRERGGSGEFHFDVAVNWDGMVKAIGEGKSTACLWEYLTSKPWYDSQTLRHLDTLTPPWPAFLLASSTNSISRLSEHLPTFLEIIVKAAGEFKGSPETIPALMQPPFGYKKEDAEKWLASTTYAEKPGEVSKKMLEETLEALKTAGVVKEIPDVANWAAEGVCKLV